MSKIIGNTVGMGLPKPNMKQTDPTKGDYVKGKDAYAKIEDIPTKPEDIGAQPKGNYLTAVPDGYATEEFVRNKIAEAELAGGDVDLSGYAQKSEIPTKPEDIGAQPAGNYLTDETDPTVPGWAKQPKKPTYTASEVGARSADWMPTAQEVGALPSTTVIPTVPTKVSAFTNDAGYLTEHQDISGKLDADKLPQAVEDALSQAKASGEFDGEDGYTPVKGKDYKDGADGVSPTVAVSAITGGHRITITDKSGTKTVDVMDGEDGDPGDPGRGIKSIARTSGNGAAGTTDTYTITYTDNTTGTFTVRNGSNGAAGQAATLEITGATALDYGATPTVTELSDSTAQERKYVFGIPAGKPGEPGGPGYTPQRGVDYWTPTDKAEIEAYIATELAKRGQLRPEPAQSLEWLKANGDTSKIYVLPDGYLYMWLLTEVESGPAYSNILNGASVSLNKRFNSSDTLKDADGYIAIDHVAVKAEDVVRINSTAAISASASYNRIKFYDSSKTAIGEYNGGDRRGDQLLKLTTSNGAISFVVGYMNSTSSDDTTNYKPGVAANIAYMRMNLFVSGAAITEDDIADLVVTINEEITESGGTTTEYAWVNTGRALVPADYEDRIVELEESSERHGKAIAALEAKTEGASLSNLSGETVFAPSPQLPADGSDKADFDADTVTAEEIWAYIEPLVAKYPRYITKEIVGKDQTGNHDWNRYTLFRRYYDAWQKQNYPAMYAWGNGSTVIYSRSVSPRIGDTLYTTAYIGTAKGTVTAVNNANQSRTVGGVVYTRDRNKDVAPTLVYTESHYDSRRKGSYANFRNTVYSASKATVSTIASMSSGTMTDATGTVYVRYPFGDRDSAFVRPKVIVIGSNEHGRPGDPAEPAIISARMIKDLCECVNAGNPFLNLLKNEYMLVFCPVINPYGLSVGGYYNGNGVNIDRNFDTPGWGNDTTSGPQGEYGGSEAETQHFMNTITESGAIVVLANHALGYAVNASTGESNNAGMCHYMMGRSDSRYTPHLLEIGEVMSANYNLAFTDYGAAPPETYGKTRSYIAWAGAKGGAVEMQAREGYVLDGGGTLHTARILEADYTLCLQFLHLCLLDAEGADL